MAEDAPLETLKKASRAFARTDAALQGDWVNQSAELTRKLKAFEAALLMLRTAALGWARTDAN